MAEEEPFLIGQRPGDHADVLVAGTPEILSTQRPNLSSRRRSAGSGHCQGSESLTVFPRSDRTGRDYGIYAGHLTGC
jgi:hypothetical protein